MELKVQLTDSLKTAMKDNDVDSKRVIRSILSSIKNSEIDKNGPLSEAETVSIVQKELKIRHESIDGAKLNNRNDLIEIYEKEIGIINQFLPNQLEESELRQLVATAIAEVQASGVGDMGKVMKAILPKISGRAPGNQVSALVKEMLT